MKITRIYKDLLRHSQLIGFKESLHFAFNDAINKVELRLIEIANEQLYVRTTTPDIKVANSILIEGEYDIITAYDPKVIIDAGAHIGVSAIYFAQKYPEARVYAIEPEQNNYQILLKNIEGFQNITPIRAAIWGTNEYRTILNRFTGPWGYTISETSNKTETTGQQINCITMMDIINKFNIDRIDILKMDIEGGEKAVFESADEWINKVQIIAIELHDRICMGCDRAFYLATKDFLQFEKSGENIVAYR